MSCEGLFVFWLTEKNSEIDESIRHFIKPIRIIYENCGTGYIRNVQALLGNSKIGCMMESRVGCGPSLVFDFGQELNGGVCIELGHPSPTWHVKIRLRFGESVSEVMNQPNNDHAIHDIVLDVSAMGKHEFGNTGFRFVRLDLLTEEAVVNLKHVKAVALERQLEYKGCFECSDNLVNQIWKTGARTVHLCCQDYILDGIKRDRMLWMGDIHPQMHVIASVFGEMEILPKSLDFIRDRTDKSGWMNDHSSYSIWWIITVWDWYMYTGNSDWLRDQHEALEVLIDHLINHIDDSGREVLGGHRFLDAVVFRNKEAIAEGLQALLVLGLKMAMLIFEELEDHVNLEKCTRTLELLMNGVYRLLSYKQVVSLQVLAGLIEPDKANDSCLAIEPFQGISPWYGYYVLEARARAGDYGGCLNLIREYWGGMIKLGATTFWEHFDIDWLKNAGRIDELVPDEKLDVHADCGDLCFKGLRHSLCHGWSAGPTAWLSRHILGIRPAAPGFKKIYIDPHLGNLEYAKGSFPTPYGNIYVEHKRDSKGQISIDYIVPDQIEVIPCCESQLNETRK
jgi:hypothetical protein